MKGIIHTLNSSCNIESIHKLPFQWENHRSFPICTSEAPGSAQLRAGRGAGLWPRAASGRGGPLAESQISLEDFDVQHLFHPGWGLIFTRYLFGILNKKMYEGPFVSICSIQDIVFLGLVINSDTC